MVIEQGKKVENPQTNMSITLPGKEVAVIMVKSTSGDSKSNEVSFCEVINGQLPHVNDPIAFDKLYIQEK